MVQCHVFIAQSLDGFIARLNGDVDWLDSIDATVDASDHGYSAFVAGMDAIVMGRNTYEKVLSFGDWHYELPVVVLSNTLQNAEHAHSVLQGTPAEVVAGLEELGWDNVYIDGGIVVQQFLRAGLVETMTVSTLPILIGSGIPLFGEIDRDVKMELLASGSWDNGLTQACYRVLNDR